MYAFIATYWAGISNWGYIGKALVGNIMIWMGVCVFSVAKGRKNLALISFCIAWASVPVMIFLQANELRPQVSVASYTDIVPAMQMVILSFECLLFLIAGCIFLSALVFFCGRKRLLFQSEKRVGVLSVLMFAFVSIVAIEYFRGRLRNFLLIEVSERYEKKGKIEAANRGCVPATAKFEFANKVLESEEP